MSKLQAYSLLTGDNLSLGPENEDLDSILELGDMMATSRPGIIVHVEEPQPTLQKWGEPDEG